MFFAVFFINELFWFPLSSKAAMLTNKGEEETFIYKARREAKYFHFNFFSCFHFRLYFFSTFTFIWQGEGAILSHLKVHDWFGEGLHNWKCWFKKWLIHRVFLLSCLICLSILKRTNKTLKSNGDTFFFKFYSLDDKWNTWKANFKQTF